MCISIYIVNRERLFARSIALYHKPRTAFILFCNGTQLNWTHTLITFIVIHSHGSSQLCIDQAANLNKHGLTHRPRVFQVIDG